MSSVVWAAKWFSGEKPGLAVELGGVERGVCYGDTEGNRDSLMTKSLITEQFVWSWSRDMPVWTPATLRPHGIADCAYTLTRACCADVV